jgi:hypothetical protein
MNGSGAERVPYGQLRTSAANRNQAIGSLVGIHQQGLNSYRGQADIAIASSVTWTFDLELWPIEAAEQAPAMQRYHDVLRQSLDDAGVTVTADGMGVGADGRPSILLEYIQDWTTGKLTAEIVEEGGKLRLKIDLTETAR